MSELQLPIGTAFDAMPEPTAYLKDDHIVYCNPAFLRALPDLTPGSRVPEEWAAQAGTASSLYWKGQSWTALTWAWNDGVLLRLICRKDDPILPNDRLPLLSQKLRSSIQSLITARESLSRVLTPFQEKGADLGMSRLSRTEMRLLRLTRSLELSALPDGTPPFFFHPQAVVLNGLCHYAQRQIEALLAEVGCTMSFQDCDSTLFAQCDEELVLTLIYHLVSNAVRATYGRGNLELRLERRGQRAFISLLDDGPGMTSQQLAVAFSPDQGGEALTEAMQGLGLGLTVCRKIALLHEGGLMLSNRPDRGLCATFSLPLCPPSSTTGLQSERVIDIAHGAAPGLLELSDVLPERCFLPKDLEH